MFRTRNVRRWLGITSLPMIVLAVFALNRLGTFASASASTRSTSYHMPPTPARLEAQALYSQAEEYVYKHTKADNQRAIELYSQAIARYPEYTDAHAALAIAYYQSTCRFGGPSNQLDMAFACAQRAIALDPRAPKGYAALGTVRTGQGRHWDALGQLHRALELNAGFLPAMRDFSLLWSIVGQPQLGLPWAKAAAELDPSNTAGWRAAADASVDLCADEQAENYYRRCLGINPQWMSAHCGLMHIHLLQGRFDLARQDGAVIDSIETESLLPPTLKAQIALFSGNYPEAEAIYRGLLTKNRKGLVEYYGGISYLSALGFLRLQAGDLTEGKKFLDEAITMHSEDAQGPQTIYDLAAIRAIQGRTLDAIRLLQESVTAGWMDYRTIQLDPRFSSLRNETRFKQILSDLSEHVLRMREESERLCAKPLMIADYPVKPPVK